jgi:hypothetical protein
MLSDRRSPGFTMSKPFGSNESGGYSVLPMVKIQKQRNFIRGATSK